MSNPVVASQGAPFTLVTALGAGTVSDLRVTALADGDLVAVWDQTGATNGDSSGSAIEAEVLGADGSVVTPTFLVNTTTLGNQILPAVTGLTSGGFVIAWQDGSAAATTGQDIRAQAFTASGADVGPEFVVNETLAGDEVDPFIAALSNGGYVVVWNVERSSYFDIFSADGTNTSGDLAGQQLTFGPTLVSPTSSGGFCILDTSFENDEFGESSYYFSAIGYSSSGTQILNDNITEIYNDQYYPDNSYYFTLGSEAASALPDGDAVFAITGQTTTTTSASDFNTPVYTTYTQLVSAYVVSPTGAVTVLSAAPPTSSVSSPVTSVAVLGLANTDIVLAWTDATGLHTGIFFDAQGPFTPVTYPSGSAPSVASGVQLTLTQKGFLEAWIGSAGAYQSQLFDVDFPTTVAFNPQASVFDGVHATTLTGTFDDIGGGLKGVEIFNGATDLGAATINASAGTWSFTATLAAGAYTHLIAVATDLAGVTSDGDAPFNLSTAIVGQPYVADESLVLSASTGAYETRYYAAGGALYLSEILTPVRGGGETVLLNGGSNVAAQDVTSILQTIDADGHTTRLSYSGVSGKPYTAYQLNYSEGRYIGAVYDYAAGAGLPYTSYSVSVNAAGQTTAEDFFGVTGASYTSYEYDFSPGGDFIGSKFFYPNEEVDLDAGGALAGVVYSNVAGASYTSVKADYVGGVYAGSQYQFAAPAGAAYSSYELDYDYANAFQQDKFVFTNVANQHYTGLEEDFDATGNLSREILTGVTGEGYTALELDYSIGTFEGYKAFYAGAAGSTYASKEVDVDAANQITKVVYAGLTSTPYSGLEQDYSAGALTGSIYAFTAVSGQSYYAYQVDENAAGAATQEILDNNDGSHTILGLKSNQTLTSVADDTMTGGGAGETFVFNAIYGHDTITDFASTVAGTNNDVIALAKTEFANWQTLLGDAKSSGAGNADTTFTSTVTHDALTLDGVTVAQLKALTTTQANADFNFIA